MPFIESRDRPKRPKLVQTHTSQQEHKFKSFIILDYPFNEAALAAGFTIEYAKRFLKRAAKQAKDELKLEMLTNLRSHCRDNAAAAIFAAKAKLGWTDKQEAESNQAVEYIDLPNTESRDAWLKRQQGRKAG